MLAAAAGTSLLKSPVIKFKRQKKKNKRKERKERGKQKKSKTSMKLEQAAAIKTTSKPI